jgi:hypothetical protein
MRLRDFGCGHGALPFLSFDHASAALPLIWVKLADFLIVAVIPGQTGAAGDRTEPGMTDV